jgi:protease I
MSANYTSARLRWSDESETQDPREYAQSAPVEKWFARAMQNRQVVKGALCHGLWVLTPHPGLRWDSASRNFWYCSAGKVK